MMRCSTLRGAAIIAVLVSASVSAQAQELITTIPDQPSPGDAFQIEVMGMTGHGPAFVSDPIMQINGSTIYLQVSVEMGPWTVPDTYTHVFDIPALGVGTYTIEFWESRLYDPDPTPTLLDSLILQLQGNPIPALSIGGGIVLILLTCGVAIRLLNRSSPREKAYKPLGF